MTSNFGYDLSSRDDVDETRTVTGVELVAEDAIWRLQTPHEMGILVADAPDYGFDLLEALGSAEIDGSFETLGDRIRAELTKDERILGVETTLARTLVAGGAVEYDIKIKCETAEGPFSLVGTSDGAELDLAVKLLSGGI
jgi:hypothetical protein